MTAFPPPAASRHLPLFITTPGKTDVLMVVMAMILIFFVLMIGILYFRLHALPEQWAHKKVQFEIVCVLALIAMFTHMHIFWIAGLLLALIDIPDFVTPLKRIAGSTEKLARIEPGEGAAEMPAKTIRGASRNSTKRSDRPDRGHTTSI